jgi:hypothetical protein
MAEIHVLETERTAVHRSVIQLLEAALEQARAGEIAACALVIVRPNGAVNSGCSDTTDVGSLLGGLSLAQHRLCVRAEAQRGT